MEVDLVNRFCFSFCFCFIWQSLKNIKQFVYGTWLGEMQRGTTAQPLGLSYCAGA